VKTVFISAGHGASDPGAVSADGRFREADLALRLRDLIALKLRSWSVTVVTDGRDGESAPLRDAVELAKRTDGPAIEIHFNAGPPGASGVEVLCHPEKKKLAQEIAGAIAKWTRSPLRGDRGWRPANAGAHRRLAFCDAGGLIVEVEFLTNTDAIETAVIHEAQIAAAVAAVLAEAIKEPSPSVP
jgi:N-acetylmuramoyl-L-alanine amidase